MCGVWGASLREGPANVDWVRLDPPRGLVAGGTTSVYGWYVASEEIGEVLAARDEPRSGARGQLEIPGNALGDVGVDRPESSASGVGSKAKGDRASAGVRDGTASLRLARVTSRDRRRTGWFNDDTFWIPDLVATGDDEEDRSRLSSFTGLVTTEFSAECASWTAATTSLKVATHWLGQLKPSKLLFTILSPSAVMRDAETAKCG